MSLPLQRVLTDFGAEVAFAQVPDKLREHYGITLPVSTIRRITERHAERMLADEATVELPAGTGRPGTFIGELDGTMVPVVVVAPTATDKRRGKTLLWKEVRLCLVHRHGSATPVFGGTAAGGADACGRQWARCAQKAGFGPGCRLHAVGDGAPWIVDQLDGHFGAQGTYLIDFYHVSEYLAEAAKVCAAHDPDTWRAVQQARLKANRVEAVLDALAPFVTDVPDAPATACDRYLRNRLAHLDYQGALQHGLPIGSGEIESAHRYVIQKRLKLSGAWWAPDKVAAMLALRLNRANREWAGYWQSAEKKAA